MDIIFVLVCYFFEIQRPIVNTFADLEVTVFGGQFGSSSLIFSNGLYRSYGQTREQGCTTVLV